jgi:hypothetical protein
LASCSPTVPYEQWQRFDKHQFILSENAHKMDDTPLAWLTADLNTNAKPFKTEYLTDRDNAFFLPLLKHFLFNYCEICPKRSLSFPHIPCHHKIDQSLSLIRISGLESKMAVCCCFFLLFCPTTGLAAGTKSSSELPSLTIRFRFATFFVWETAVFDWAGLERPLFLAGSLDQRLQVTFFTSRRPGNR